MKGRAKVLDSGFMEFIEYLQKIGELHNILRMIDSFNESEAEGRADLNSGQHSEKEGEFNMLFSFWRKGWIEIRETDRRGKDWHRKEYALLIRLEEISAYCSEKKRHGVRASGYPMPGHNMEVIA